MKDLLRISDLSPDGLDRLLNLAAASKRAPHTFSGMLAGETVVCFFAKPSTRARLAFATAVTRLGGVPQIVGPNEFQLGQGETIADTAAVISCYARVFVIRTFADADVRCFADAATVPVINALTDTHHPCQALADLMTLREHYGTLEGLKVAYVGDGNNVAHSLMEACALAGVHMTIATPREYEPRRDITESAQQLGHRHGVEIVTMHDPRRAVLGADAVYTDVWVSMGIPESERAERTRVLEPYRVTDRLMATAKPSAIFMHCLPAHRGEEVAGAVIDGPHSVVFEQAENRLHTAIAVLVGLLNGSVQGRDSRLQVGAVA